MSNRKDPYDLKGIIVPIYTPVCKDQNIDEKGLARLAEHVIDGGVNGIFVMGSMGGCSYYNMDEKIKALKVVKETAGDRVPILFGVIENSTKQALSLIEGASKYDPDYLVLTEPGYFNYSSRQVYSYYEKISNAVKTPVMIYNRPVGVPGLSFDLINELSLIENIIGIKDSSCDFSFFLSLIDNFRNKDFLIFQGDESMIAHSVIGGADGAVVGTANIAPDIVVNIYNHAIAKEYEKSIKTQKKWNEIVKINLDADLFAGQPAALELMGICSRYVQHPMKPATEKQIEKIKERMIKNGILIK